MIEKIMLGTVQFGLNYGIANKSGQVTPEEVQRILKAAYDRGVRYLDTAISYGNSEIVLGQALDALHLKDKFHIVTKIRPLPPEKLDDAKAEEWIRQSLGESLQRLGIPKLYGCMFHHEDDAPYLPLLKKLKSEGKIDNFGISLDSAAFANGDYQCDILQAPCNILDSRFDQTAKRVKFFARSTFLQGLLLMEEEAIPAPLKQFTPQITAFEPLRKKLGLSRFEFYLRYNLSRKENALVLIGVDSLAQLEMNLDAAAKGPLPPDVLTEIEAHRPANPEALVRPHSWARA